MKTEQLLEEIENLARQLDIELRYEKGEFRGGLCVLNEQRLLIIHSKMKPEQKLRLIAREMAVLDLTSQSMPLKLRNLIESFQQKTTEEKTNQN